MSKREDQRIAALAKKNAAKVKPPTATQSAQFDPTLRHRPADAEDAAEAKRLYTQMTRREF